MVKPYLQKSLQALATQLDPSIQPSQNHGNRRDFQIFIIIPRSLNSFKMVTILLSRPRWPAFLSLANNSKRSTNSFGSSQYKNLSGFSTCYIRNWPLIVVSMASWNFVTSCGGVSTVTSFKILMYFTYLQPMLNLTRFNTLRWRPESCIIFA